MMLKKVSLRKYNSFGLDYTADQLISVKSEIQAVRAVKYLHASESPLLILGGGSNLLFTEDFRGTIIHPQIGGIKTEEKDSGSVIVSAGAGVRWDTFVEWCVGNGLGGPENLSLIPGSVGASPVQNVGAYGVEVRDFLHTVQAVSIADGSVREFHNQECNFGYRSSIFKKELKGKYLITRVLFRLAVSPVFNLDYGTISKEVSRLGGATLGNVRRAVIETRRSKLPDPEDIGNAGSFFKNPVVDISTAEQLRRNYPQIPLYGEKSGGVKIAAGWLIEQCGWKEKNTGKAAVYDKQALVIVNRGGATGKEIFSLSEEIRKSVWYKFEVELEREVEVVGSI